MSKYAAKLSEEQRSAVVKQYKEGLSTLQLGRIYKVAHVSINNLLRARRVALRSRGGQPRFSPEQRAEIATQYKTGFSTPNLAKSYGVEKSCICRLLARLGIAPRLANRNRKYRINHSAFDVITNDAAYWLGFLMADGYVDTKRHTLSLSLQIRDKQHLECLLKFLGSNSRIFEHINDRGSHQARFQISSARLVMRMIEFGIISGRTHIATAHQSLDNNLHFWRGVIDGNGCLGIYNGRPELSLVGAKPLMDQFLKFAKTIVPQCHSAVRRHRNIFTVSFVGKASVTIVRKLYNHKIIALERKMLLAEKILSLPKYLS